MREPIFARIAGMAKEQAEKNPNGLSYGFDPFGGAFSLALPLVKVSKALQGLKAAGKISQAAALEARLLAKAAGKQTARTGGSLINDVAARNQSTSVFPRINSGKVRTAPNRILEMQGQRRAGRYTDMDRVNDFMSGYPTTRAEARALGRAAKRRGK